MPYVYDPNLDKDKEDQEGQLASGASEVKLAGGSSTSEAQGSEPNSTSGKELNTGSGYQNLDKYLSTNESQKFGNQVLGKVGETLDTAKQNQAQASDAFKNQVTKANYTPEQSQLGEVLANPSQANAKDFQNWMTQTYSGPKSIGESQNNWNKFWSGTNQANTNAKLLGSEAGRFSLLDTYFGRPQYNFGEKSLDNLLVQQGGIGRETRNLQNEATQLRSKGEEQAKNLQGFAANRAGEVNQSRENVNQAFNQAQGQAQQEVQNALQQSQSQRSAEQAALRSNLAQGRATQDQMAKLGLREGQELYNLDLAKYLSLNPNLTKEQVATDEQRARLNALSQLAGQQQTYLGAKENASNAYGFDSGRFQQDVAAAKAGYQQDYGNAIDVIKKNAPLHGQYLESLNSNSSPSEIMNKLTNETTFWEQEKANGNPWANTRLNQLATSKNALMGALNKYNIDAPTGSVRALRNL